MDEVLLYIFHIRTQCTFLLPPNYPFLSPSSSKIISFSHSTSTPLLWVLLIGMVILLRLAYDVSFATHYIFVNNSVTSNKLGSFNGLAGALTALFRFVREEGRREGGRKGGREGGRGLRKGGREGERERGIFSTTFFKKLVNIYHNRLGGVLPLSLSLPLSFPPLSSPLLPPYIHLLPYSISLVPSLSSLCRTFSPLFAGSIYSVSLTTGLGYPLDYHLIFVIIGLIILAVMFMVASLPESIKKHKVVVELEGGEVRGGEGEGKGQGVKDECGPGGEMEGGIAAKRRGEGHM